MKRQTGTWGVAGWGVYGNTESVGTQVNFAVHNCDMHIITRDPPPQNGRKGRGGEGARLDTGDDNFKLYSGTAGSGLHTLNAVTALITLPMLVLRPEKRKPSVWRGTPKQP